MATSTTSTTTTTTMTDNNNSNNSNDNDFIYVCQHGGPGDLEQVEKQPFVVTWRVNFDKVYKTMQYKSSYQELLAAELIVMEELCKMFSNNHNTTATTSMMIDQSLMKLYFSMATKEYIASITTTSTSTNTSTTSTREEQGRYKHEEMARMYARTGIYLAMYLFHGNAFWEMTNQPAEIQQITLKDMYTALGQIHTSTSNVANGGGLPKVLMAQVPCQCIQQQNQQQQNQQQNQQQEN